MWTSARNAAGASLILAITEVRPGAAAFHRIDRRDFAGVGGIAERRVTQPAGEGSVHDLADAGLHPLSRRQPARHDGAAKDLDDMVDGDVVERQMSDHRVDMPDERIAPTRHCVSVPP
jgi:hypothetical protein